MVIVEMYRSDFYPGMVTANGKKVVAADVEADNGIIHIVEDALYPLPQPSFIEMLSNDPMFVRFHNRVYPLSFPPLLNNSRIIEYEYVHL